MMWNRMAAAACALAVLLGAAGCGKRDPRDIPKWKAAGDTEKLVAATRDERQFVRLSAIEALGELKVNKTIDPLAALFSDPDLVVVHSAIDAVAGMDDPRVEQHMLWALGFRTAPARRTAAQALGNRKSETAVDPLIAALNDADESVVAAAATALGQIGNPKAVGPLLKKVGDRSFDIRIASVTSLSLLGGPDSAEGLESALGDISEQIREIAVEGLVRIGPSSVPLALNALRSENHFARESGAAILEALDAVPAAGSDGVWYRLTRLTAGASPKVDPARAAELTSIEGSMEALLEALSHEQDEIRDYALLALAEIGESAAAKVLAAAEEHAGPEAEAWLNGRSEWPGAPDWRIDLFSAATVLNPRFSLNRRIISSMIPHTHSAEQMMKSTQFQTRNEYIPLLIIQFATTETQFVSDGSSPTLFGIQVLSEPTQEELDKERAVRCRERAAEHLVAADYRSVLPLLAALDDDDPQLQVHAVRTLVDICGERIGDTIAGIVAAQMENGKALTGTPFYHALLKLNLPAVESRLLKIRPDEYRAVITAERKYPGVEFQNIPLEVEIDPHLRAAPFRLVYFDGIRERELRIIFRPDASGSWIPDPPLPDRLP